MTTKRYETAKIASVRALLERGRRDGFVTFRDVDRALPVESLTSESLDAVKRALEAAGIDLRQDAPACTIPTEPGSFDSAVDALIAKLPDTPLLTREGEVELARRIEKSYAEIRQAILVSDIALPELSQFLEKLGRREVRPDQVTTRSSGSGRAALGRQLERALRRSVLLEHRYRSALARGARVEAEFRKKRREYIAHIELADPFWLDVASRIFRTVRQLEGGGTKRRGLSAEIGIGPKKLRFLACDLSRAADTAEQAKTDMVESNVRLVVSFARRFKNAALPMPDIIQEGNVGLLRAIDKFDYRRGYRFSTYASWWIRQGILRAVSQKSRTIRVPVHMTESMRRVARTSSKLYQHLGRRPSDQEIADAAGLPVEKILVIRKAHLRTLSLGIPAGEEGRWNLSDFIVDDRAPMGDEEAERGERCAVAERLLANLTPREQKVLRMRFGVGRGRPHTLREIGKVLGVSRERVRQIEAEALEKLRIVMRQAACGFEYAAHGGRRRNAG
jgi:RNA polymerase primary sigma factor